MDAKTGDRIAIESERVGTPQREADVLEVIERSATVSYRVQWDDGHQSIITPAAGAAHLIKKS